ncbi:MAG: NAD(P)-dependent alcohol dehydrogenase [Bacteroidetes bacterium]|nr:MAG: NAD(P)-dependent alcohol dehydrogenase [Bacteroidota bacterium]
MKRIIYETYGDPEVLKIADFDIPQPQSDEVLVKVMAAGINPVDYKIRNGSLKFIYRAKFPRTPGGEISGKVEKAGEGAKKFSPGDRVYSMLPPGIGGYSEYVNVKEDLLSVLPGSMPFNEGAAIPLAGLTSLQALRDKGEIKEGMEVLVNGGSGGVGMFAIQIAKAYNAKVTTVCSGKNVDFVKSFGADIVIDYEKDDFTQMGNTYDIIFDAVAKSGFSKCKKILKKNGIYITTLPSPGVMFRQIINPLLSKKSFAILTKPGGKDLDYFSELIRQNKLIVSLEKVFNLEDANLAHKHIETGRTKGKLVIQMEHRI